MRLGTLFVGLDAMSGAFGDSDIKNAFANMFTVIDFPLLLILIGTLFTALIQSSSAATGLLIIMVGQGALSVANALFIVLGTNIGTCITAVIASIGTSTNAKRTALIHLTFNIVGTVFFTIILWFFSPWVVKLLSSVFPNPQMQIAWFHVAFNVITTILLLPFINQLVGLSKFVIKDKVKPQQELPQLKYIDDRLLHTPPIAVVQVQKEILLCRNLPRKTLLFP